MSTSLLASDNLKFSMQSQEVAIGEAIQMYVDTTNNKLIIYIASYLAIYHIRYISTAWHLTIINNTCMSPQIYIHILST